MTKRVLSPIPVEPLTSLVRSLAVNGAHVGWLFGAGTSASAGVPTAGQLLDEFKAALYASECNLDRARVAMADPLVAERVRRYFDGAHSLAPLGASEEYAVAFERAYPDPAVRRQCLDRWLERGRPSFGHRVVAALMATGHLRWIATTNFDDLPERAYDELRARDDSLRRLTVAAIDSAGRAARALREDDWPLLIKLHGDIASEVLKNTTDELQQQDEILRRAVLDASRQYGLAIIGYSGRDESVMGTLRAALTTEGAFPHGLAWLASDPTSVMPAVGELLEEARARGVDARFVEAANFDEVFGAIAQQVTLPSPLAAWLNATRAAPRVTPVAVTTTEAGRFPALRLNALPVLDYPRSALRIRCHDVVPFQLRPLLKAVRMPGFGVASGREVLAFGVPDGWRHALADYQPTSVEVVDIDPGLEEADSLVMGLTYEAVARALVHGRPLRPLLRRSGHRIVVAHRGGPLPTVLMPLCDAYGTPLTGTREGGTKRWSEGVRLRLEWRLGRLWLLFEPWTFVEEIERSSTPPSAPRARSRWASPDASAAWVKERWATRRNKVWAAALGAWADVLVGSDIADLVALDLSDPRAVDARFRIARQTAYSLPAAGTRAAA
jgi:NAD-dependent SIR2 family protein deacetylase